MTATRKKRSTKRSTTKKAAEARAARPADSYSRWSLRAKYPGLVRRIESNSRKAAIRMMCLECVGGSSAEVRRCEATLCPLWSFRERG